MLKRLATASPSRTRLLRPTLLLPFHPPSSAFSSSQSTPTPSSSSRSTTLPPPVPFLSDVLNDPNFVKKNLVDRNYPIPPSAVDEIRALELEAIGLRKELQDLREKRNAASSAGKGERIDPVVMQAEGKRVKVEIKALEAKLGVLNKRVLALSLSLPNTSHPFSPIGPESAARIVATYGPLILHPPPPPDPTRDHTTLSSPTSLNWTDFPSSSLISGSSWSILLNEAALLELALTNYAMSIAISHSFTPVMTPDVVRSSVSDRCGFAPRDGGEAQQTYFIRDEDNQDPNAPPSLCLVGTAEIPLVAMNAGKMFSETELPLKFVGLGRAFRAEAGAGGAESRGLYRVHQFTKVEMVVVSNEEGSDRILEELREIQVEILKGLGLSIRVLDMPTEELGSSAHRKYDIEAFMPGRGKWGELSSASNCTSFQSRRLSIRYRPSPATSRHARGSLEDLDIPTPAAFEATAAYPSQTRSHSVGSGGPKALFAHTLNATAAAVPRLIVALLENGAVLDREGKVVRVRLPGVLKRFWVGKEESERIEWVREGEALRT